MSKKAKKIVIGFNGSLDSIVGAYLLKKQGYEVIGIGIQFYSTGQSDSVRTLFDGDGNQLEKCPFQGVHIIEDLDQVKGLADAIGINFYAVEGSKLYQERVTDYVVGARIGGRRFYPLVAGTKLIFDILFEKSQVLKADLIATGHYAKIVANKTLNSTSVFVSNDLEEDQSYLLSSLDEKVLKKLILPLSDMRVVEVRKIAKGLSLNFVKSGNRTPLMERERLGYFVSERCSDSFIHEGQIMDYKNESILGDHQGVHTYGLGQKNIKTLVATSLDKDLSVIKIHYRAGLVYLGLESDLSYQTCVLQNMKYFTGVDLSSPVEVFIKTKLKAQKVAAILFSYNNQAAEIYFRNPQVGQLYQGDFVTIYNKKGAMGRVLGAGVVRVAGVIEGKTLRNLPKRKDELENEDESNNIDIYRFRF